MIRMSYGDREYTIMPDDSRERPVKFGAKELGTWITILNVLGFKIDVLSGGTKS